MNKGSLRVVVALLTFALLLAACGASSTDGTATSPSTSGSASSAAVSASPSEAANESETSTTVETGTTATAGATTTLRVGATPVPHAEILRFVQDNLAAQAGLNIEIVEFTDYVQPNIALNDGQIDANFFQHVPYMEDFAQQRGLNLTAVVPVHVEPLGIYSREIQDLNAVPDGAQVAIPNDAVNAGRALQLMAANNLVTVREGADTAATVRDVTNNPKNLDIRELEAAQLPRALDDADLAVINGNYALEADLTPSEDALVLEAGENNPYANVLAVVSGKETDPNIVKLGELLNSDQVKQFIQQQYRGSVIPAF
jgi:D-methionine transport system substrate-binding protein